MGGSAWATNVGLVEKAAGKTICFRIVTGAQHDRNNLLVMSRPSEFGLTYGEARLQRSRES
jgi:hypothetical protein